jgi:hypothetical protein
MPEIVPHGYISVCEAVNHLGCELFPEAWTGKEHKARRGLISEEGWLKKKDLAPPRGGGAPGSAPSSAPSSVPLRTTIAASVATALHSTGDPSIPSYQAEYRARKRYENACYRLRALLEAGDLEAAILDPFTGKLHRASTAMGCRFDADRMIEKGTSAYSAQSEYRLARGQEIPRAKHTRQDTIRVKINIRDDQNQL